MRGTLHRVESHYPDGGTWTSCDDGRHCTSPVRDGSVGPVDPSIHPFKGYPFCSQYPGTTWSKTLIAESHLSDL